MIDQQYQYWSIVLSEANEYYLGTELSAYRVIENHVSKVPYQIYPIFENDKIIAISSVTYNDDNELVVGCMTDYASNLNEF